MRVDGPGFDQFIPAHVAQNYRIRQKVENWDQAPAGSYVQFVLDHRPYRPVQDPNAKVLLSDLAENGEISEGEHVLAVYLVRPNGESIKAESSIAVRRFWVGKRTSDAYKSSAPMLIVGHPYGTYEGEAAKDILVDFFVLNATMGAQGYSVKTTLTGPGIKPEGIARLITDWQPYLMLSPHEGEYTLEMRLLDPAGEDAPGPWNSLTRKFTVKP